MWRGTEVGDDEDEGREGEEEEEEREGETTKEK